MEANFVKKNIPTYPFTRIVGILNAFSLAGISFSRFSVMIATSLGTTFTNDDNCACVCELNDRRSLD